MWKAQGAPDRRHALFGGRGTVKVWSLSPELPPPFEAALGCELSANGSVGAHVQDRCSELVIVTEGRGEFRVGGQRIAVKPGSTVSVPLGATLELENRSRSAPLRYLIIKASQP